MRGGGAAGSLALVALVLLALGLGVAALVSAGDEFPPPQTRPRRTTVARRPRRRPDATAHGDGHGRARGRRCSAEPTTASPACRRATSQARSRCCAQAVLALNGSNTLDEAYASYNLAYSRFAVGRCDGVVGLLDRSERIQGHRSEIDELRRQWEERCAPGEDGEAAPPGNGRGKGEGHHEGGGGEDG